MLLQSDKVYKVGGFLLLFDSLDRIRTETSVRKDQEEDIVIRAAVFQKRSSAAEFDIGRMGTDCQDIQDNAPFRISVLFLPSLNRRSTAAILGIK